MHSLRKSFNFCSGQRINLQWRSYVLFSYALCKEERCIQDFGGETRGKEIRLDGRIILKWIFRKWDWDIDWIDLAQNKGRWLAHVNVVMNLRYP